MQHHATAKDEQIRLILPKRDDLLLCIQSNSVFEEEDCHRKKEKRFAFSIACESESRHE